MRVEGRNHRFSLDGGGREGVDPREEIRSDSRRLVHLFFSNIICTVHGQLLCRQGSGGCRVHRTFMEGDMFFGCVVKHACPIRIVQSTAQRRTVCSCRSLGTRRYNPLRVPRCTTEQMGQPLNQVLVLHAKDDCSNSTDGRL